MKNKLKYIAVLKSCSNFKKSFLFQFDDVFISYSFVCSVNIEGSNLSIQGRISDFFEGEVGGSFEKF